MHQSLEFLIGLLDRSDPTYVAADDFAGVHGSAIRHWHELGFLRHDPVPNPKPSCPHCEEGMPFTVNDRHICPRCHDDVEPRHLLVWPLDVSMFLDWLKRQLALTADIRRVTDDLWQLGTWTTKSEPFECFFARGGYLSEVGKMRIAAYRNSIVFVTSSLKNALTGFTACCVRLLDLLRMDDTLTITTLEYLFRPRGTVLFDPHSGALRLGDTCLGEVPPGSREYFFLACLAHQLDHFVTYADIKHFVLKQSGSRDSTEEATFCQGLKSRIKKKWISTIDQLLVTTNKGDGYRLRAFGEISVG